jgi:hypothetical protein
MPALSDTDVRIIEQVARRAAASTAGHIAIDMRRSLLEARRQARGHGEKLGGARPTLRRAFATAAAISQIVRK